MLKFIGTGSAFNTKLGNNSAYYKKGNQMLLIDCGSNIFHRIKESNLLEGVEHIHVLITHTHADHVGSLADLILYTYYSHGKFEKLKVTVYSAFNTDVGDILRMNGCTGKQYRLVYFGGQTKYRIEPLDIDFQFIKTKHVKELHSYSIELTIEDEMIFYSGDINTLDVGVSLSIEFGFYDKSYIDTCSQDYWGNPHLSLKKLAEQISPSARHNVWCMHIDEDFDVEYAKSLGFNVAEAELEISESLL